MHHVYMCVCVCVTQLTVVLDGEGSRMVVTKLVPVASPRSSSSSTDSHLHLTGYSDYLNGFCEPRPPPYTVIDDGVSPV